MAVQIPRHLNLDQLSVPLQLGHSECQAAITERGGMMPTALVQLPRERTPRLIETVRLVQLGPAARVIRQHATGVASYNSMKLGLDVIPGWEGVDGLRMLIRAFDGQNMDLRMSARAGRRRYSGGPNSETGIMMHVYIETRRVMRRAGSCWLHIQ